MNQQLSQSGGDPVTPVTPVDKQYSCGAAGDAPFADLETAMSLCPPLFALDAEGLWHVGGKNAERLTLTPLWVQAMLCDTDGHDWSIRIAWRDLKRSQKERIIETAQLRDSRALIQDLGRAGLFVLPGAERDVLKFLLTSTTTEGVPHYLLYRRLGFGLVRVGEVERLAFMLPGTCLLPRTADRHPSAASPTYFLPRFPSRTYDAYHAAGDLEEWKTAVAPVRGNVAHVFALCVGLAAPFVALFGSDNVIYHLYGESSRGKTLALQLFASLWGCGADPQAAASRPCLVERWNSTGNATELIAATHSGIGLAIDELGSSGADTLSVYNMTSGRGKMRMTETGGMRDQHTWSLLTLSSGEESIADKIETTSGRKAKAGELIRAMDIFLDDLPEPGGSPEAAGEQATRLKRQLGETYGTAGPAFVQVLLDMYPNEDALREWFAEEIDHLHAQLIASAKDAGLVLMAAQERALRRFALVAAIGLAAVESEVLPFSADEVGDAVERVAMAWLTGLPASSTTERVTEALRDYVLRNQGQFTARSDSGGSADWFAPQRSCGIIKDHTLLLTTEQFRCACGDSGVGMRQALRALCDSGVLRSEEPGRFRYRVNIAELGIVRREFYALRLDKLLTHENQRRDDEEAPLPA